MSCSAVRRAARAVKSAASPLSGEFIRAFRREGTIAVVDPVLGDHGRAYRTCTPEMCRGMVELAESPVFPVARSKKAAPARSGRGEAPVSTTLRLPMTDQMAPVSAHWQSLGLRFDAIYTGFMGSREQIGVSAK